MTKLTFDLSGSRVTATATALPALTGSDKQVAWATKLRDNAIASLGSDFADAQRGLAIKAGKTNEQIEQAYGTMAAKLASAIDGQTSASWWIDNRGGSARYPNAEDFHNGFRAAEALALAAQGR